jgi:hypothetical protein
MRRLGAATLIMIVSCLTVIGASPSGATVAGARRGAACLPGNWKLDLQRLTSEASVTQTLTASGSVDLQFRRGNFLETYSDILTGTGTKSTVEQKYAGAVSGKYHTTGSAQLDLTDISNATEMVMTVTVSGVAGAPNRQAPAPGTQTAAVTLAFTCRGNSLQITAGGPVAQHYSRVG